MEGHETSLLAFVIGLPLLGAAINGLVGRRFSPQVVHSVGLAGVGLPAILAWALFAQLLGLEPEGRLLTQTLFPWIHVGTFKVDFALWLDPLSMVMVLIITNVGSLIHLYSVGYMKGDPGYWRFFSYLNLFIFSMLCLVLGENLLVLFLGWEGVGLCSYLLIGFWFTERANAKAGKKAFITNRVGDVGFALGTLLLFAIFGTVSPNGAHGINTVLVAGLPAGVAPWMVEAAALLLFVGATGKSAQIPLYFWLPDAMAGPTPVSALIHAATMVTAGVYMIARLNGLFFHAELASQVVFWVGASTALFAATIGLVQNDIKKVLAYSTVSQLGFMFTAMGAGAWSVGMFHLMTHAFFKACLFLGSGAVILSMHHEQDMRFYGGLRKYMPTTYRTFLVATLAISGVPLFSGFFSKDEILWWAFASERGHPLGWALIAAAAFCTAFYMFRILWMTFWGEHRGHGGSHPAADGRADPHTDHGHDDQRHGGLPVEQPWVVTVPLVVLAFLSLVGGYLSLADVFTHGSFPNLLHDWFHPVFEHSPVRIQERFEHGHGMEIGLMAASVAIAAVAIAASWLIYGGGKSALRDVFLERWPGLHRLLWNKWFIDEAVEGAVLRPIVVTSREVLWRVVDEVVIDGFVNFVGGAARTTAQKLGRLQSGDVGDYAAWMVGGALLVLAIAFGHGL